MDEPRSPAYYTSMGFAVPAALGAMVARPKLRPLVLVGDSAFQMTGMELFCLGFTKGAGDARRGPRL